MASTLEDGSVHSVVGVGKKRSARATDGLQGQKVVLPLLVSEVASPCGSKVYYIPPGWRWASLPEQPKPTVDGGPPDLANWCKRFAYLTRQSRRSQQAKPTGAGDGGRARSGGMLASDGVFHNLRGGCRSVLKLND